VSAAIKERPILMSGPMVRALLAGTKTQTRRVVKFPPWAIGHEHKLLSTGLAEFVDGSPRRRMGCPYGVPGDRLWVRESFAYLGCSPRVGAFPWGTNGIRGGDFEGEAGCECFRLSYAADNDECPEHTTGAEFRGGWHPSIHMPRWASRITLEVTGVRVQRIQDISEEDARAEGCPGESEESAAEEYAHLWNSINGPGAWDLNPWVWAVSFRRVQP